MKPVRAFAVVPSLDSGDGSSVNESEFLSSLSKKVSKLYIITFVGFHKFFFQHKKPLLLSKKYNAFVIVLPNVSFPLESSISLLALPLLFINSLNALLLFTLINSVSKINFLYIRDPRFAIAFVSFKLRLKQIAIKFPGFYVQELLNLPKIVSSILEDWNYRCVRLARPLIVHSELYEGLISNHYLVKPASTFVMPPSISWEKLESFKNDNFHIPLEPETFKIGFIGSATWWNGLDILVEAMAKVVKDTDNAVLIVAGLNKKAKQKLSQQLASLNVKAYLFENLSHSEALKLMSKLSVLVVPRRKTLSTDVTIPIKVSEAFALSVPVIITNHTIFQMKYKDAEDVLFCSPDPESVARKIIFLMNNDHVAHRLSVKGPFNAQEFNYDIITSKLLETVKYV